MPQPSLDIAQLEASLETLRRALAIRSVKSPESHRVVVVVGVEGPEVVKALSVYLVACLAGAVKVDTSLAGRLLGGGADPHEVLTRRVHARLGRDNDWTTSAQRDWRDRRRNPWITEGIAHVAMLIAASYPTGAIRGEPVALKPLHPQVTQQGLDLVAIYSDEHEDLWLAIGESKATLSHASEELSNATAFFRKVERGERDGDLIADLLLMEPALDDGVLDELGETLWLDRRTYVPLVAHGSSFEGSASRPAMKKLRPPRAHKRVVLVQLSEFLGFFDEVATEARAVAADLLS